MTQIHNLTDSLIIGVATVSDAAGNISRELITLAESEGGKDYPMREIGSAVACVGAPGSGKTDLIVSQLQNWGTSAAVVDLKGGVYSRTAAYRASLAGGRGQVVVLDPRDGTGHRFNPVQAIRYKARRDMALQITGRGGDTDGEKGYWARQSALAWLAAWEFADQAGRAHIPYAVEMMQLGMIGLLRYALRHHSNHKKGMAYLRSFVGAEITPDLIQRLEEIGVSKLLESKWSSVEDSYAPYTDPNILNVFNGHDLDVSAMFHRPITVYIQADESDPEGFGAFLRPTMKALGDALINAGDKLSFDQRAPVLFLFDEFGAVRVNNARQWINTMRSRGVVLCLFAQSLAQLPSEDGRDFNWKRENSIHHWILFSPVYGANDTGAMISDLSGTTTVAVLSNSNVSFNVDNPAHLNTSQGVAYRERRNLEAEDIDALRLNVAYVSVRPNGSARRSLAYTEIASPRIMQFPGSAYPETGPAAPLSPYQSPLLEVAEVAPAPIWEADGAERSRERQDDHETADLSIFEQAMMPVQDDRERLTLTPDEIRRQRELLDDLDGDEIGE